MRSLISMLTLLIMSGCAVPTDDMTGNRFPDVAPKLANKSYVGLWTGANGPGLITLRIDEDGRGVSCSSWNGQDSVSNIKLSDDTLYFQDGTRMALAYADGYINGVPSNAGSQGVRFAQDSGLVETSPYCREKLQQPYL